MITPAIFIILVLISSSSSQQCTTDDQCDQGPLTKCDANRVCVECTRNSHCRPTSYCNSKGNCVPLEIPICTSNSNCAGTQNNKFCNKKIGQETGECVFGCGSDRDCPLKNDPNFKITKNLCENGVCVEGCRPSKTSPLTSPQCNNPLLPRCNTLYNVDGTGIGKCDVECRQHADCRFNLGDSLTEFCIKNKCLMFSCRNNADCLEASLPKCNLVSNQCIPCTANTDCSAHPAGGKCTNGNCVCNTDSDCSNKLQGSKCHPTLKVCSCSGPNDCKVASAKTCSPVSYYDGTLTTISTCGACGVDAECGKGSVCTSDLSSKRCLALDCSTSVSGTASIGGICGCLSDNDCKTLVNTTACDVAASKCVACTRDTHCKSWERCNDARKCVALKCSQDFDCIRKDLGGNDPEARCSDAGVCVPVQLLGVNSVALPDTCDGDTIQALPSQIGPCKTETDCMESCITTCGVYQYDVSNGFNCLQSGQCSCCCSIYPKCFGLNVPTTPTILLPDEPCKNNFQCQSFCLRKSSDCPDGLVFKPDDTAICVNGNCACCCSYRI